MNCNTARSTQAQRKPACHFWNGLTNYAQAIRTIVRTFPSTLLWPLLLLSLLCGLGVWLVAKTAHISADNAKTRAMSRAKDAAAEYGRLLGTTLSVAQVLASLVRHDPHYSAISALFNATAPALASAAPYACIRGMELVPAGVVRQVYPAAENEFLLGLDVFKENITAPGAIKAVGDVNLNVRGPRSALPSSVNNGSGAGSVLLVSQAIHLPVVNSGEEWGRPDVPNAACGAPCGYNATTGTKFWGFIVVVISLDALRIPASSSSHDTVSSSSDSSSDSSDSSTGDLPASAPLLPLAHLGYRYALVAPAPGAPGTSADGSGGAGGGGATSVVEVEASPGGAGRDPVQTTVELAPGVQWTLLVGPPGSSWMPSWYGGIMALVAVVSVAASVLLFGLLVSRRRSHMLLHTLLPAEMIQDLHVVAVQEPPEPKPRTDYESPADVLMELLNLLLSGLQPDVRDVVLLRTVLRGRLDVYRPFNLKAKLHGAHLDTDVASALMRQLGNPAEDLRLSSGCSSAGPWSRSTTSSSDGSSGGEDDGEGEGGDGGRWNTAGSGGTIPSQQGAQPGQEQRQPKEAHCRSLSGALEYMLGGAADEDMELAAAAAAAAVVAAPDILETVDARPSYSSSAAVVQRLGKQQGGCYNGGGGGGGRGGGGQSRRVSLRILEGEAQALSDGGGSSRSKAGRRAPPRPPLPSAIPRPSDECGGVAVDEGGVAGVVLEVACPLMESAANLAASEWSSSARRSRIRSTVPALSPRPPKTSAGSASGSCPRAPKSSTWSCPQQPDLAGALPQDSCFVAFLKPTHDDAEGNPLNAQSGSTRYNRQLLLSAADLLDAAAAEQKRRRSVEAAVSGAAPAADGEGCGEGGSTACEAADGGKGAAVTKPPSPPPPSAAQHGCASPCSTAAISGKASPLSGDGGSSRSPSMSPAAPGPQRRQSPAGEPPPPPPPPLEAAAKRASSAIASWLSGPRISSRLAGPFHGRSEPSGSVTAPGAQTIPGVSAAPREGVRRGAQGESRLAAVGLAASPSEGWCSTGLGTGEAESAEAQVGSVSLPRRVVRMAAAAPPRPLVEEVERLLAASDNWQFDTWGLQEASCGHACSALGFFLIHRAGLVDRMKLEPVKLARLLRTLEAGYPGNPYHNSAHAADVLHSLHVLLHGTRINVHYLDSLGLLAAYFAAIVHDYGHPGLTNDFLVATSHPLALRYNDRSPLESHHAAAAFTLLVERPDLDITSGFSREQRAAFRKQVVDLVLATDMKQHFAILNQFNTVHRLATHFTTSAAPAAGLTAVHGGHGEVRHGGCAGGTPMSVAVTAEHIVPPKPINEAERALTLQVMLKAADIGHLGSRLEGHMRWLSGLEEEFFRQGDQERQMGLPVSPLFERGKKGVSKSQVGFYEFVALPLVRAATEAFPGVRPLLECFRSNYYHWRLAEAEAEAQAAAAAPPPPPPPAAAAVVEGTRESEKDITKDITALPGGNVTAASGSPNR